MSKLEEKKNRRIGIIVSVSVHATLFLIFLFLVAWREPNPPLPEYGIELNFGTEDAGSGVIQPITPVTETENQEDAIPEESSVTDPIVDQSEEVTTDETLETENSESETSQQMEQPEVYEDDQSQDIVEDVTTEDVAAQENVEETDVVPENSQTADDTKEIVEQEGAEGEEGDEETPEDVNQGNKEEETGDQGSETGKIDERALFGTPGGDGGSLLDLAGWTWDFKPDPDDTSNESGKIVFEIKIDGHGEIISITTLERSVTPSVEAIYKREVGKLTFSKTDNLPAAPVSTGKITFVIRAK